METFLLTALLMLAASELCTAQDAGVNRVAVNPILGQGQLSFAPPIRAPRPPGTTGSPRRIAFDRGVFDNSQLPVIEDSITIPDGSAQDESFSEWVVVSRSGYEYDGSQTELRKVFASLRSSKLTSSFEDGRLSLSGGSNRILGDVATDLRTAASQLAFRTKRFIFGGDNRVRVSSTSFPWSAIGQVENHCSGAFIGPRHILTAGHCVFNFDTKKWFSSLNFYRRKDCDPHDGTFYRWTWALSVKGWTKHGNFDYDFAMIVVDRASPVWMGYGWRSPMPKYHINIAGYPGDKRGNCMWRTNCDLDKVKTHLLLDKGCDCTPGMSGSPVWVYWSSSNKRIIYGLHSGDRTTKKWWGSTVKQNQHMRITKSKFELLKKWKGEY